MSQPTPDGTANDRRWPRDRSRAGSDRRHRHARPAVPICEALEGRVVLSRLGGIGGGSLVGALAAAGIPTAPVAVADADDSPTSSNALVAQLRQDLQQLRADEQALAAKSGLTVADLTALANDSEAIFQAGARIDRDALNAAVGELANAVAGGTDTTQAKADFDALFAGSAVSQGLIDQAFADLTKAIQDSGVTTADLQTISDDRTNVRNDLTNLSADGSGRFNFDFGPGFGPGPGQGFGGPGQGGLLASALNNAGVVTGSEGDGPGDDFRHGPPPIAATTTTLTQLRTDLNQLQADSATIAAKSGVTVADLTALANDTKAIFEAGTRVDPTALNTAVTELANAVAAGTDTTQAKADFDALFAGSTVAQATIDQSFADLTKAVQDSKATTADLQTIANDQANIKNDLAALQGGSSTGSGPGTAGGCGDGSSSSGSGASGSSSGTTTGTGTTGDDGFTVSTLSTGATASTAAATGVATRAQAKAAKVTAGKAHVKAHLAASHQLKSAHRKR